MQLSWAEWPEDADPAPVLELPIPEARFQLDIGAPMVFQWYFCGPSSAGLLCVLHLRACDCDKQFRLGMLL